MADHSEVTVEQLYSISKTLLDRYFVNQDMYALLVLAFVTITEYSRKAHHFNTNRRVELTLAYIPDLLTRLQQDQTITDSQSSRLRNKLARRDRELVQILHAYIYASAGLRTKIEDKADDEKRRCTIC
jgi:hypothetical protein